MTLEGIDVSYAQAHTPSLVGKAFAFAKATQGGTVDPLYAMHAHNIRSAGIVQGAYHFGVPGAVVPVATQVTTFLATVADADLLAVDDEGTHPMTAAEVQAFINGVRRAGRRCGLYHSLSGFPTTISADFRWVAFYASSPPTIGWDFWQYSNTGTASGLDLDRYRGSLAELQALAGIGGTMIAPSDVPTEFVDLVAPPGGVAATVYAEDFTTKLGSIGPTSAVKAYGIVRPRAAGAALSPVLGPLGSSFAEKVGWLGVDWIRNRRLTASPPTVATLTIAATSVTSGALKGTTAAQTVTLK